MNAACRVTLTADAHVEVDVVVIVSGRYVIDVWNSARRQEPIGLRRS
jgi:hypothetical protein